MWDPGFSPISSNLVPALSRITLPLMMGEGKAAFIHLSDPCPVFALLQALHKVPKVQRWIRLRLPFTPCLCLSQKYIKVSNALKKTHTYTQKHTKRCLFHFTAKILTLANKCWLYYLTATSTSNYFQSRSVSFTHWKVSQKIP